VFGKFDRLGSAAAALIGEHPEAGGTGGNDGKFGHCKYTVQNGEHHNNYNFQKQKRLMILTKVS
jgi:hypothetical protein